MVVSSMLKIVRDINKKFQKKIENQVTKKRAVSL